MAREQMLERARALKELEHSPLVASGKLSAGSKKVRQPFLSRRSRLWDLPFLC